MRCSSRSGLVAAMIGLATVTGACSDHESSSIPTKQEAPKNPREAFYGTYRVVRLDGHYDKGFNRVVITPDSFDYVHVKDDRVVRRIEGFKYDVAELKSNDKLLVLYPKVKVPDLWGVEIGIMNDWDGKTRPLSKRVEVHKAGEYFMVSFEGNRPDVAGLSIVERIDEMTKIE